MMFDGFLIYLNKNLCYHKFDTCRRWGSGGLSVEDQKTEFLDVCGALTEVSGQGVEEFAHINPDNEVPGRCKQEK